MLGKWWWWCSGLLDSWYKGGSNDKGRGRGNAAGKAASPPRRAVECSWAFLLSSARLLFLWRSPVPGLQQPHNGPGHPGDQVSISCNAPDRWSLDDHNEEVVDDRDVAAVLTTLLANKGGENWAAKCGEKRSDVGGSTGLNPAVRPGVLEIEIITNFLIHLQSYKELFN